MTICLYPLLLRLMLFIVAGATQNYFKIVPNAVLTDPHCPAGDCYTLEYVLTHYEQFFISNTTIELLPGEYVVNKSYGNIIIDNVENQIIRGRNHAINIVCTNYGTLGVYFLNVTNVSVSNIHFLRCSGEELSDRVVTLTRDTESDDYYSLISYVLASCTLVFDTSSNIYITNITVSDVQGTGLLILGVYDTFQLSQSVFNNSILNCVVITLASEPSEINSTHEYTIKESWFANGKSNASESIHVASGLSVLVTHNRESTIHFLLSNLTIQHNKASEGNLLFSIENCVFSVNVIKTSVIIELDGIVSEGSSTDPKEQNYATKGLVLNPSDEDCGTETINFDLIMRLHNSKFIKRCIEIGVYFKQFSMVNVLIQRTSCWCLNAVRIVPLIEDTYRSDDMYSIENMTLIESCGLPNLVEITFLASEVYFKGSNIFSQNNGTIYFQNSYIILHDNVTVANSTSNTSSLHILSCTLYIDGNVRFENNTGRQSGGIQVISSTILQQQHLKFIGNKGFNGGALAFYDDSQLQVYGTIVFENNLALNFGGAIYVDDAGYWRDKYNNRKMLTCFYRDVYRMLMRFTNNTAMTAGSALYGGWIDMCIQLIDSVSTTPDFFLWMVGSLNLTNTIEDLSTASSNPARVCICTNFVPQCNITEHKYEHPIAPGESFNIQAVAVGQRFGTVPSPVTARLVNTSVTIDEIQKLQNTRRECTTLNYTIRSPNREEVLSLTVERNFIPNLDPVSIRQLQIIPFYQEQLLVFNDLTIVLTMSECPLGYSFNTASNTCTCQETLTSNGVECYFQNKTVIRKNQMWINATFTHTDETIGNPGVLVHHNCPFDYCKNLNRQYLDLQYPNYQCAFERSGILCGKCSQNLSHVFGTSQCKKCSNYWILSILLFTIVGIGLVVFLIMLDLTVSIGTINGLIFYAHTVRANQATFFPPQISNTFLSWFIAWLNLDVGFEMCFFDGLDAYTKTWLQFLFPIYIWILVIVIIVTSHYYTFAARLSGSNAVQVLATLFLMSYAKLLRIVITILSSTTLTYPDGHYKRVWLYDGNIDYLKGKHIPLFIAALILLIFLSIPYTLVLLGIQWLRLLPSYRILFWVRKFKPLFDAYTGVFKRQHGYWTGFLLLARAGLFLVFALNVLGDPSINLLAIASTVLGLITYLAAVGGVYRQKSINLTEYTFLLNLGILSTTTLYTRLTEQKQETVITISVGVAFSSFILIVFCHIYKRLMSTYKGRIVLSYISTKTLSPLRRVFASAKESVSTNTRLFRATNSQVTHTTIELREPLLKN